jgi:UDP-2-acetamido-2,6-beta-L-arabino-hexul-4-ose reductase
VKVAVTGAQGLIGWHLMCALHAASIESCGIERSAFDNPEVLAKAIADVDVVVHAAGANRGDDAEVSATNVRLATVLAQALRPLREPPAVIFTNSTHTDRDTAYGRSKLEAAALLANGGSGRFVDLVLPGVFGEHGKPFYNSVVSTFCHQLSVGDELSVNDDAQLELIHAQDVADVIIDAITSRSEGTRRVPGETITVTGLAHRLTSMHSSYSEGVVPSIAEPFNRALFNTMRSYRFPSLYPTVLDPKSDQRGRLVELVKADTGGQMFISSTKPGITRGNHYHRRKVERFVVVEGAATISLRRLFSAEALTFEVSGDEPVAIDMPTMHTHNITNVGDDSLTTVFWADEIFDPERPDTFGEVV